MEATSPTLPEIRAEDRLSAFRPDWRIAENGGKLRTATVPGREIRVLSAKQRGTILPCPLAILIIIRNKV